MQRRLTQSFAAFPDNIGTAGPLTLPPLRSKTEYLLSTHSTKESKSTVEGRDTQLRELTLSYVLRSTSRS